MTYALNEEEDSITVSNHGYCVLRRDPLMSKQLRSIRKIFDKSTRVFGVYVFGTSDVDDSKFDHAVNVLRDYLDNDGDGVADSKKLVKSLKREKAAMTIFYDEDEIDEYIDKHERKIRKSGANLQDLFDFEIVTAADRSEEFDASLEEVFHLISDYGYSKIYSEEFGLTKDSLIGQLMNDARGGYFRKVPKQYPDDAYYTYYDKSCNYKCQITEYFYWGMTSVLGGQQAPGRLEQIQDEWRLNTPGKVAERDPALFELLTNGQFDLPAILPDGII